MEYIKRQMDFVLITEYMDESLVLLKRKWCWDMEDILYLPAKVRTVHRGRFGVGYASGGDCGIVSDY